MKLKVLMVDDELLVRERFVHFVAWEEHGFELIGAASNGKEALEMMENELPHLLLADITMPVLDGLELAEIVRKRWPKLRIVFLTAHSEFEYAKRALMLGAVDYMLKVALSEDQIIDTCRRVAEGVYEEMQLEEKTQLYEDRRVEDGLKAKKEMMRKCMEGSAREQAWHSLLGLFLEKQCNAGFILLGWDLNRSFLAGGPGPEQFWSLQCELAKEIECHQAEELELCLFPYNSSRLAIFVTSPESKSFANFHSQLVQYAYGLLSRIKQKYSVNSFAYVDTLSGSNDAMYVSFTEAQERLASYFYSGHTLISSCNAIASQAVPPLLKMDLVSKAMKGFSGGGIAYLEEIRAELTKLHEPPLSRLSLLKLTEELIGYSPYAGKGTGLDLLVERLPYLERMEDYREWWAEALQKIANHSFISVTKIERWEIRKACQYIKENYQKEIRLSELADQVNLNTNYMGQLFKQETGEFFSDYFNRIRIMKAKELLESTGMKIYEVAGEVGIKDYRYFCKLFKKLNGVPPTDYKHLSDRRA